MEETPNIPNPKNVYLIYQTFVNPEAKTRETAVVQGLIMATTNIKIANSYCLESKHLTVDDCWALVYADKGKMKEFHCQVVPLDKEMDIKSLIYE